MCCGGAGDGRDMGVLAAAAVVGVAMGKSRSDLVVEAAATTTGLGGGGGRNTAPMCSTSAGGGKYAVV